ncbi:hypothetical protein QQ045_003275 [Rhodiola kirilowii]
MGHFVVLYLFLSSVIFLSSQDFASHVQAVFTCQKSDIEALMTFKIGIQDPYNRLMSWEGNSCCEWPGIKCDNISRAITALDLSGYGLGGNISSSLAKLGSSTYLDLSLNSWPEIPLPEFIGSLGSLTYLNLSKAGFYGTVPPQFGNLSNLEYLDLSSDDFESLLAVESLDWLIGFQSLKHLSLDGVDMSRVGLNWLEDLNKLSRLNELHMSDCLLTGSISSLSMVNFTSLVFIDFSFNSFFSSFPNWILNISSIRHIDMTNADLYGRIPLGVGELPNLEYLNLAVNNLSASSYQLFKGSWSSIKSIYLSTNKLIGKLPSGIGNMTSLVEFDLFLNNIEGGIPSSIGKLCNLRLFDLSSNNLTGCLPEHLSGQENCESGSPLPNLRFLALSNNRLHGNLPAWLGQVRNLIELSLTQNSFQGPIPSSLGGLRKLNILELARNNLNGTVPETLGNLSSLSVLDLSSNQFSGMITEAHFRLMASISILILSSNSLTLSVGSKWVPPFQVVNLDMASCRLGPTFPTWLGSQKKLMFLNISNSSISGSIPTWFWDISANLSLLNISFNHLEGQLPNPLPISAFADVDLSSNIFHGPIPLPTVETELLHLSKNKFTGTIPSNIGKKMPSLIILSLSNNQMAGRIPSSIGLMTLLEVLDLSENGLSGTIPSRISNMANLKVLDLSNNNLSGSIPSTIGQLKLLQSLHLNNNHLSGYIPRTFRSLLNLETLDLWHNFLSGTIPSWLGQGFTDLRILNLRSNNFSGEIPDNISKLSSLQVLDLSENSLTGSIPSSLGNLAAMTQQQVINKYLFYGINNGLYYEESLTVNVKNGLQRYTKTLSLVTSIDLSDNRFSGTFPDGITNLSGLLVLNLSRNHIKGYIPDYISRMRVLTSLDFSNNRLSGHIPPSMSSMTFLGAFNVSNNDLSGKIPESGQLSTFPESAFEGNPGLCGYPLSVKCADKNWTGNEPVAEPNSEDHTMLEGNGRLYMSIGIGFAVGLVFPLLLVAAKKSWRLQYLKFLSV